MRALRTYSTQLSHTTYSSVHYIHHVVHYILVLIYVIPGSLYLLTAFIQFPLPTPLPMVATNLFFYEFVCF